MAAQEARPAELLASAELDAGCAEKEGRGEQAVLGWVRAAAVARMVHGDGHWKCAQYHVCTARCYLDLQGLLDQAQQHATEARDVLQVYSRSPHSSHLQALYYLSEAQYILGRVSTRKGSLDEAEKLLIKADGTLNQYIKSGGSEGDPLLGVLITWRLGSVCMKQKKLDLAKMLLMKGLDDCNCSTDPGRHKLTASLVKELADLEMLRGDPHAAITLLEKSEENLVSKSENTAITNAEVSLRIAKAYMALHREGEADATIQAEDRLLKAHAIYSSQKGPSHPDALACQDMLLKLLLQTSRNKQAISLLTEMLPLKAEAYGEGHLQVAGAWKSLASLLLLNGDYSKAVNLLKKAKSVFVRELGNSHTDTIEVTKTLDALFRNSDDLTKPRFETVFRTVSK